MKNPILSVEEANRIINDFTGNVVDFTLVIGKTITLNNKIVRMDIAFAIITDTILGKGWFPNWFIIEDWLKIYHYTDS